MLKSQCCCEFVRRKLGLPRLLPSLNLSQREVRPREPRERRRTLASQEKFVLTLHGQKSRYSDTRQLNNDGRRRVCGRNGRRRIGRSRLVQNASASRLSGVIANCSRLQRL